MPYLHSVQCHVLFLFSSQQSDFFPVSFLICRKSTNLHLITTQRLKNDLFLLNWCSVNVQSACNPYCILQSRAIASHLQEACQNPLLCIVSEPGNLNMYCSLSNFPKCCYIFWGRVRLCLYLPQPWAWEYGKKKGKRIMGKRTEVRCSHWKLQVLVYRPSDFKVGSPSSAFAHRQPTAWKSWQCLNWVQFCGQTFLETGRGKEKGREEEEVVDVNNESVFNSMDKYCEFV